MRKLEFNSTEHHSRVLECLPEVFLETVEGHPTTVIDGDMGNKAALERHAKRTISLVTLRRGSDRTEIKSREFIASVEGNWEDWTSLRQGGDGGGAFQELIERRAFLRQADSALDSLLGDTRWRRALTSAARTVAVACRITGVHTFPMACHGGLLHMTQQQNGESARSGHNASLAHLSALTTREPFSPQHLGHPLPYLDVFSFQSKRLLPVSRQDLLQQRTKYRPEVEQVLLWARRGHVSHVQSTNSESDEEYDSEESNDDDSVASGAEEGHEEPPDSTEHAFAIPSHHIPAYDELARRLLLEPIQLPDLIHTGVDSKYLKAPSQASPLRQQQVPDAEVKLFYASGAKNTNMREYIKETIEKHMGATSPTGKTLKDSASAPVLAPEEVSTAETTETKQRSPTKSPAKRHKTKGKHKQTVLTSRLIASVSTSALLNPELRRQAQEVLTQIRANAHKVNDLIGST